MKTVHEEEERGECIFVFVGRRFGSSGSESVQSQCFCTFGDGLSCFRTVRGGRRCCCWADPEGPGTRAARLDSPAQEEGLMTVQACPTPMRPGRCRG